MAGIKISALPAVINAQLTDIYPVVQAGVTSRETISQLVTLINSSSVLTGFVPIAGGTMSGPLILSGDPSLPLGAATKEYVDMFAAGITVILSCYAGTTGNLNVVQAGAGVGATLTDNSGTFAAFTTDGVSPPLNSRILVKNQTLTQHNGIYVLTTNGDTISVPYVLTRATDYDTNTEIIPGTLVAINNGTTLATTSWLETATVAVVDTDPVLFSQFTFAPSAFLLKANNLSDVASVATSLVNLGLGVPTGTGNVVRQTSPTLVTPSLGNATAASLTFSPTTNGIVGTNTNDNASAGYVGEILSSVVPFSSAVSLTTNVAADITSISLSAGDWDVWGNMNLTFSTASGYGIFCWISLVSATAPDRSLLNGLSLNAAGTITATNGINSPTQRISVNGPTTVYLSGEGAFTSGTCVACGGIYARRRR